jgi:hypothetical protein
VRPPVHGPNVIRTPVDTDIGLVRRREYEVSASLSTDGDLPAVGVDDACRRPYILVD